MRDGDEGETGWAREPQLPRLGLCPRCPHSVCPHWCAQGHTSPEAAWRRRGTHHPNLRGPPPPASSYTQHPASATPPKGPWAHRGDPSPGFLRGSNPTGSVSQGPTPS